MKKSLLSLIVCPSCKNNLTSKAVRGSEDNIEEGELACPNGHVFPITNGIPRLLAGHLERIKEKTAESFAFEWETFSDMRGEWKKNFDFYFEPAGLFGEPFDFAQGKEKVALEVGCGNGRHTMYAAKAFKELVSVDLGGAVDVAFKNNKASGNIHFIQADIDNLPFRENSFDFVFCLGVLHHLPRPEAGFKKLVALAKEQGNILIYIYHSFSPKTFNFYLLGVVNFFRQATSRLPHRLLYTLCYPIAWASYVFLVWPYKFFFKKFIKKGWPLGAYADYTFFVMLNDTFDRFSAPIENRYSRQQALDWYTHVGLKDIKILGGSGWRLFGKK